MAQWMWRYGDHEIYHSLLLHARREEMGADYPAMWHTDSPAKTIGFRKDFECASDGYMKLITCGKGYIVLDGVRYASGRRIPVLCGHHSVNIRIVNVGGLPAAYVESDVCPSDGTWLSSECGSTGFEPAGTDEIYDSPDVTPEIFPFRYEEIAISRAVDAPGGRLYDMGRETFARVTVSDCDPEERFTVVYGESREEALDCENAVISEEISGKNEYVLRPRALRYLFVGGKEKRIKAEWEYLPLERRGSFRSDDELMDRIWDVSAYTFHLNSREFFLDGIKRDRWVWSGDAYQSYMVNSYLFFDKAIAERTMLALRGRDDIPEHINTILDYSLYWLISIRDHYRTYGDIEFVKRILPKMRTLLAFVEKDTDENGFLTGGEGAWIFVDWSEMDKTGAISAEQLLYCEALRAMAECEERTGNRADELYDKAARMLEKVDRFYWDAEKGAYIDSYSSGRRNVTRHPNILAVMFGLADKAKTESIVRNVILNDSVRQITTPYFKFFEMDVLCRLGFLDTVTQRVREYWGGMLKLGATSVWEQYIPERSGTEHYEMYGNRFGCSLCHAWGAGPVYLLGRYYLGVSPSKPGYEEFTVEPHSGGIKGIEGTVPTPRGDIRVKLEEKRYCVYAGFDGGTLRSGNRSVKIEKDEWTYIDI